MCEEEWPPSDIILPSPKYQISAKDLPRTPQELETILRNYADGLSDALAGRPPKSKFFAYVYGYQCNDPKTPPSELDYPSAAASA
ncbi:hypothetical protein HY492_04010 [Candidatus Woesearchaeota archaeon]|nr:hypothetical protein [Candidatus Woesearchaeota archaeon]